MKTPMIKSARWKSARSLSCPILLRLAQDGIQLVDVLPLRGEFAVYGLVVMYGHIFCPLLPFAVRVLCLLSKDKQCHCSTLSRLCQRRRLNFHSTIITACPRFEWILSYPFLSSAQVIFTAFFDIKKAPFESAFAFCNSKPADSPRLLLLFSKNHRKNVLFYFCCFTIRPYATFR